MKQLGYCKTILRKEEIKGNFDFIEIFGEKHFKKDLRFEIICEDDRLSKFRYYLHTADDDYKIMDKYQEMCKVAKLLCDKQTDYELNFQSHDSEKNVNHCYLVDEKKGVFCVISLHADTDYEFKVNNFYVHHILERRDKIEKFNYLTEHDYEIENKIIQTETVKCIAQFANIKAIIEVQSERDCYSHKNGMFISFYKLKDLEKLMDLADRIRSGC